jgi:hypothetical protein
VQIRFLHGSKRTLKFDPKCVSISPAKYNRISWKQIASWRLAPLPNASGLSVLRMEYSLSKRSKVHQEWSMVLDREQEPALLSELNHLRQLGSNRAELIHLKEPFAAKHPPRKLRCFVASAFAFWLLVHGLPLLGVGLESFSKNHHRDLDSAERFSPKESAKLQQTLALHFRSFAQFRAFLLISGGAMTGMAAGLYVWSFRALRKSRHPEEKGEPEPTKPEALSAAQAFY